MAFLLRETTLPKDQRTSRSPGSAGHPAETVGGRKNAFWPSAVAWGGGETMNKNIVSAE